MTDRNDPRFAGVYRALVAALGDDDVALPNPILERAVIRILDRIDAAQEKK